MSSLPLSAFYQGRTLNFGHRGASHDAPENTLAAFELAARYGADGIELDVSLTADGVPIVIHDDTLDRTTDGSGNAGSFPLAEIKRLDAGRWFDARFAGECIPTLDEVFEAVGKRLLINVELKGFTFRQDGLEARVAERIAHHNLASRVIVSSFNPLRLRRLRRIAPHIPIGFLHEPGEPFYVPWLLWRYPREADHPHQAFVTSAYMVRARRSRLRVNTWVVDDPARMGTLRDLGVDMIITNRPDVLAGVLRENG